jgi:hypothetical protein
VISPLLSNLYLNEVDKMLERAKEVTRYERWTAVEYARFADDLVILVDPWPRQQWLKSRQQLFNRLLQPRRIMTVFVFPLWRVTGAVPP